MLQHDRLSLLWNHLGLPVSELVSPMLRLTRHNIQGCISKNCVLARGKGLSVGADASLHDGVMFWPSGQAFAFRHNIANSPLSTNLLPANCPFCQAVQIGRLGIAITGVAVILH